jgi:hypothetical protein
MTRLVAALELDMPVNAAIVAYCRPWQLEPAAKQNHGASRIQRIG